MAYFEGYMNEKYSTAITIGRIIKRDQLCLIQYTSFIIVISIQWERLFILLIDFQLSLVKHDYNACYLLTKSISMHPDGPIHVLYI